MRYRARAIDVEAARIDADLTLPGRGSPVSGSAGDFLIFGPDGEVAFLSPALFETLFVPAGEAVENGTGLRKKNTHRRNPRETGALARVAA